MATDALDSDKKYCISCGDGINKDAEICPNCGVRQESSNLSSSTKFCADCGEEIKVEAEICPECGVRQESGVETDSSSEPEGKPDAGEAFKLMVAYYQKHRWRGAFHFLLAIFTAGGWALWFVGFWFWTLMGWKNIESMREIRASK